MKSLSIGAPLCLKETWNQEGASYTRDFERWIKGVIGMEHFFLKRLSEESLWKGLLYWRPWKIR